MREWEQGTGSAIYDLKRDKRMGARDRLIKFSGL
jgi:hypothetical protein